MSPGRLGQRVQSYAKALRKNVSGTQSLSRERRWKERMVGEVNYFLFASCLCGSCASWPVIVSCAPQIS